MKNFIKPGDRIPVIATAAVVSGQPVLVGRLFGIATHDAAIDEEVQLLRQGVVLVPKLSAQAWTVGQRAYWNDTDGVFTTVATGNLLAGLVVEVAANPSDEGVVLLDGAAR